MSGFVYRMTWVKADGSEGMLTFKGDTEGLNTAKGFGAHLESEGCHDVKIFKAEKK